jgi:hypothetical protein
LPGRRAGFLFGCRSRFLEPAMSSPLTETFLRKSSDLYTGPLITAGRYPTHEVPGAVIFEGFGHDLREEVGAPLLRVRMVMSAEDAEDILRTLYLKIRAAKQHTV